MSRKARRHLTIMLVPDGGRESKSFRVSFGFLRLLTGGAILLCLALILMAGSWWFLAARAARVTALEDQVAELEVERARVVELGRQLREVEQRYGQIRDMFGPRREDAPPDVWLPPASGSRRSRVPRSTAEAALPTSWPLTEKGFVTQGLLEGDEGEHPGLDIAVPTDSYIRAAGSGTVVDAGEDPVYGHFVVLDHGDGYTTLYGHASMRLVERGQEVRRNEVIALSGSTGRSTAPHLHFEILRDGEPVDPLSLLEQP